MGMGACVVPSLESLEASNPSACNEAHLCVDGYVCVGGWCRVPGAGTDAGVEDAGTVDAGTPAGGSGVVNRRVLVIAMDPVMSTDGGTQRLTDLYPDWTPPAQLAAQLVTWWNQVGAGTFGFTVVQTWSLDAFPRKADGFLYTPTTYLATLAGQPAHTPDTANLQALLADSGACALANAGEVDEVWMFGGPWFGIPAEGVAGPRPPWFGNFTAIASSCTGVLPVMGFNYELPFEYALRNFDTRILRSLDHAHGGRSEGIRSPWDLFTLFDTSGRYGYRGCGLPGRPPNASTDDYGLDVTVQSVCDDFLDFPNLASNPGSVAKPLSCSAWSCNADGYRRWWWAHVPRSTGLDRYGRSADWLRLALHPAATLAASEVLPCGWLMTQQRCANASGCRWSACAESCVPSTVPDADGGTCPCPSKETVPACDATPGCAWYRCQSLCQQKGIPLSTGCGSMPYAP